MSKILNPKMVSFGRWEMTECVECGFEYQVTRTEPKTLPQHKCVCSDCDSYNRGYADGVTVGSVKAKEEIVANMNLFKPLEDYIFSLKCDLDNAMDEESYSQVSQLAEKIETIKEFKRYVENNL